MRGYASHETVLNPGKFLIIRGAIGVTAALVVVRFGKAVQHLAVIAAGCVWLALFTGGRPSCGSVRRALRI
ncbi:hypothetical protein [Gordonia oryzae]|uniref:hypothetical protein n=1 Tax=Gordonia oryzae TaxID=2487349 RepID=UPI0026CF2814